MSRLGARVIDGVILAIPLVVAFALIPGVAPGDLVYDLVGAVVYFAYYVILESSKGTTPGKRWLSLRVADEAGGSPITREAAVRRNAWILVGLIGVTPLMSVVADLLVVLLFITIGITIAADPRKQGLHDRLGGTVVELT